jgi:PKD repeat protein
VQIQTPVANFSNAAAACANYTYELQDNSSNNPTGWWWEIPGANPPLSSLKNPIVTFPTTGSYNVTLTVNNQAGTSSSISQVINVLSPPQVSVTGNLNICKGTQTSLTAQGATSYLWSNGSTSNIVTVQPNISTAYMVTGYDAQCFDTVKVNVTVYQALATPIITTDGVSLFSNYSNGNQWYLGNTLIVGATMPSYTPTAQAGLYRLGVTDSTGCASNLCAPFNFQPNGVEETSTLTFPYIIYPNPNSGKYFMSTKSAVNNLTMKVYNVYGESLYQQVFQNLNALDIKEIQLPNISKGIYFVQVIINGKNYTSKMSIE